MPEYNGQQPRLNFRFSYPPGWELSEEVESDYAEVVLDGPEEADPDFGLTLSIAVFDAAPGETNLRVLAGQYAKERRQQATLQITSQRAVQVAGRPAEELELRFRIEIADETVTVRQRVYLLLEYGRLYEINYSASQAAFDRHAAALDGLLESFTFHD